MNASNSFCWEYIRVNHSRTLAVLSSTFEYPFLSESDYIKQFRVQIDWTSLNKLLVSLRLLMDHNGTVSFAFWMWLCCHYNYIYTLVIRSIGCQYIQYRYRHHAITIPHHVYHLFCSNKFQSCCTGYRWTSVANLQFCHFFMENSALAFKFSVAYCSNQFYTFSFFLYLLC